ncbi:hypothetical protein N7462_007005 [Penicillium macrosclerotiorum]|uniref:uncharacterized protein n=1 Tax=Penicillium macrosclerotiorum TaxID=303699 RepID=UPI0025480046|nr:uncharacterized protein N7462_007005 [Penicillium macrosclerotiorum]KAJ5678761.1 hypothetical protein N7462_007005 [Penicillium macrosclerotiorum]
MKEFALQYDIAFILFVPTVHSFEQVETRTKKMNDRARGSGRPSEDRGAVLNSVQDFPGICELILAAKTNLD